MSPTFKMLAGFSALVLVAGSADAGPKAGGKAGKSSKVKAAKTDATAPKGDAAAAKTAEKVTSYEDVRTGALPAGDLANLVEPLYAECKQKEDHARRQCEQIRTWNVTRLHGKKWVAVADATALQVEPYDATEKSISMTVNGCIACEKPPVVAGSPRLLVTRAPKAFADGAPIGLEMSNHGLSLPTAQKAAVWNAEIKPRLRVEFVFAVGEAFDVKTSKGVSFVPVAHRIYDMCSGEVIASEPASAGPEKVVKRDPSCPAEGAKTFADIALDKEQAALPDTLTRDDITKAMLPVQQRVYECGEEFELKQGQARVRVQLTGSGGHTISIDPPFEKGDVHLCIRAALNDAVFPHFKSDSPPVKVNYPFVLRR